MAIIEKKLIHFKTWDNFISPNGVNGKWDTPNPETSEEDGTAVYGQIKGTSIVFIKDVGKIWTHGKLYAGDDMEAVDEYESLISNKNIEMPTHIGGLEKGTTVEDLEGKTISEILDMMLFPTIYPIFSSPTASLSYSGSLIKEVGSADLSVDDFVTGYNPGSITLNGEIISNRGGSLNGDESFIYVNGDTSNKTLPSRISLGNTTFNYRAAYNEGPQPKDSKGNDYSQPLSAGTVDSNTITINGTYPWFASTANASASTPVVKQNLISWNTTIGSMSTGNFKLQPSGTLTQVFKLPRQISSLQMLNTVSDKMEVVSLSDYTETTEDININGNIVTYYVYTYNGSTRGSVTLLAKF